MLKHFKYSKNKNKKLHLRKNNLRLKLIYLFLFIVYFESKMNSSCFSIADIQKPKLLFVLNNTGITKFWYFFNVKI